MKKLTKIKLNEAAILNDSEMKMVLVGSGTRTYYCYCYECPSSGFHLSTDSETLNDLFAEASRRCGDGYQCSITNKETR